MARRGYVQSVTDLSDGALRCHAFGHPWEVGPVQRVSPVGMEVWQVKLTCPSCTKTRLDYVEPGTYELEGRRYSRPDGFSVIEPADRHDYRQEVIRRAQMKAARRG